MMQKIPCLCGVAEIAELAGVARQVVSNWAKRMADFPTPLTTLRMGQIWDETEVRAWLKLRNKTKAAAHKAKKKKKPREIVIGDSIYEVDAAYRAGAKAYRQDVSFTLNPHREGSYAYDQWDSGHSHESEPDHALYPEKET